MKILTVEDDAVARMVLDASLRSLGHEAILTRDGDEAWARMRSEPARVIVSDWKMPGMDGLDLCRRVRSMSGEYTYFILLTQLSATDDNQQAALEAGVDDFLTKTISMRELRMRLHVAARILDFSSQVRRLERILPICGYCKRIRDDGNAWQQLESYIHSRTGSNFSHGICPECYDVHVRPVLDGMPPPPA